MKFRATIKRTTEEIIELEIIADSEEQAEQLAYDYNENLEYNNIEVVGGFIDGDNVLEEIKELDK